MKKIQCICWMVCMLGFVSALSATAVASEEASQPAGQEEIPTTLPTEDHGGKGVASPLTTMPADQSASTDTSIKGKYTRLLILALIIGTIGATWFTVAQRSLGQASPGSCFQLVIIIAMILFGMIATVWSIIRLIFA